MKRLLFVFVLATALVGPRTSVGAALPPTDAGALPRRPVTIPFIGGGSGTTTPGYDAEVLRGATYLTPAHLGWISMDVVMQMRDEAGLFALRPARQRSAFTFLPAFLVAGADRQSLRRPARRIRASGAVFLSERTGRARLETAATASRGGTATEPRTCVVHTYRLVRQGRLDILRAAVRAAPRDASCCAWSGGYCGFPSHAAAARFSRRSAQARVGFVF